jgi:D-alanyl-D-alanine carboxypeptidase
VRRLALIIPLTLCVTMAACGGGGEPATVAEREAVAPGSSTAVLDSAAVSSEPTIPATTPPTSAAPTTTVPSFSSAVGAIDAGRLPYSWRPGCPVAVEDLRLLTLTYWGFDDRSHQGELVVHRRYADAIVSVFAQLFDARFPIERMELVDAYEGNDDRSMVANNTSAFNCREVAGRPGVLSEHSLGGAIDINPLINPWVHYGKVDPPEGAQYADRNTPWKGAIYADDVVVRAFAAIGWGWGGAWPDSHDYQHFSASGR